MTLFWVFSYFLLLTSFGSLFTRHIQLPALDKFYAAFLFSSILGGIYYFFIVHFKVINSITLFLFPFLCLITGLFNIRYLFNSLKALGLFFREKFFKKDRYSKPFIISIIVLLIWILLLSDTPPRNADAMRYHLAELKDIIFNHGFIFRPYLHYNFPIYFELLFFPIFVLTHGIGIKLAVFGYFLLSLSLVIRIAYLLDVKSLRLLFFLLFLTPLSFYEAHLVFDDWPLIFYILCGFLLFIYFAENAAWSLLYSAFIALGFALGIKYQAGVFIPWFIMLGLIYLKKSYSFKTTVIQLGIALFLMTVIASPFYIRNWLNTQNPFWPLAGHLFPSHNSYYNVLINTFSSSIQSGNHSWHAIWLDLLAILSYPLIPATTWILILWAMLKRKYDSLLKIEYGFILFFVTWWLMQPILFLRFALYILPLALIMAVQLFDTLKSNAKHLKIYFGLLSITLIFNVSIAVSYSPFYLAYHINNDKERYHRFTWFYQTYRWINHHTEKNAVFLCILNSGQTYYLNRPFLRADSFSALINWEKMQTQADFLNKLKALNIHYIIFADTKIFDSLENKKINTLIQSLLDFKKADMVHIEKERIYSSRFKSEFSTIPIKVIKIR